MARIYDISKDEIKKQFISDLKRIIQSSNINFLIGSGCSCPAINTLGNIEKNISDLKKNNKNEEANKKTFKFIRDIIDTIYFSIYENSSSNISNNKSNLKKINETKNNYNKFLSNINNILVNRRSKLLLKQATIFSTNYDLFIESSFDYLKSSLNLILIDGFRRYPSLNNRFSFSTLEFYNEISNRGNIYSYKVQIPSINLIKLHGSLSWKLEKEEILYLVCEYDKLYEQCNKIEKNKYIDKNEINEIINNFQIILPTDEKFKDTLLKKIYYDLLRLYSNELDKENTVLIIEGFSFADEHICDITKRALKNPTLQIILFCYNNEEKERLEKIFSNNNNVSLIYNKSIKIDFKIFNDIFDSITLFF